MGSRSSRPSSRSASLRTSVGQLGFFQAVAQLVDLGLLAASFAQLLLDGPHLLAQVILALLAAHFALGLAGDLLPQLDDLHLVRQELVHQPQRRRAAWSASSSCCSFSKSRLSIEASM